MCLRIVTSDLPVFDPIDKTFFLQFKCNQKQLAENDASVLEFPNNVADIHQVVSRNTSMTTKIKPVTFTSKSINILINEFNSQLSQQTKPLAMYHTKLFE